MTIEKTDEELVSEIQKGDVLAFEILVKRYQRRLFSFVLHVLYHVHAAEEVVQDTLFAAYKTIDRVDTTKKFSSYLFAIAKNTAISYLRRRKQTISFASIEEQAHEEETLYDSLIEAEKQDHVKEAISQLEDKYRSVITLYYFDDLSYQEISKKRKLPVNTVRTHLFRAKKELKALLQHEKH
ncbi:RNA polymerase sigma factor [Candidatus Gottesmanbacteria bacterium]|nr:RNA polymerase sigma factor [Candidatus Gottesmanbacteria bacterium]